MLLEMHSHTSKHSTCSHIDPVSLVKEVARKGLQGIVITEHHYLWRQDEIDELRRSSEVNGDFLIMAGQEVESDIGHVVVLGAGSSIPQGTKLRAIRRRFPDSAIIWAHPLRKNNLPAGRQLLSPMLDAVEIFSVNHTTKENCRGLALWHKHKFTAVSGSDVHFNNLAGIFPTHFEHPVADIGSVINEIKHGRCRPFLKEIPKSGGNLSVTEVVIGTKGESEKRERIIIKNASDEKQWRKMTKSLALAENLGKNGFNDGPYRVARIIDVSAAEKSIIEEGQRGKSLFELILTVSPEVGMSYVDRTAGWLARLHRLGLRVTTLKDAKDRENRRFDSYAGAFAKTGSPYNDTAEDIVDFITARERKILSRESPKLFVQNHGDFHPKNVIIGQDRIHDISTLYVSVIDFDNTILMPASFDVGYFTAQFRNQFLAYPDILKRYAGDYFLKCYAKHAGRLRKDFGPETLLFELRANLSIAAFLIKVGKGVGKEMDSLIARSVGIMKNLRKGGV
ncbi:MAG: phosphotransferase [Candidatus Omnitrophota bacterium]